MTPTQRPPRRRPLAQNPLEVKRRRWLAGLDQETLARIAGISPSHLSLIERGKRSPRPATLRRLAEALNCPMEELLAK